MGTPGAEPVLQHRVLQPRPPFRFDLALAYLRRSPLEPLEVVEDGAYRRALWLSGRPRLLEVRAVGNAEAPRLEVRLVDGPATAEELDAAACLVMRCFRTAEDVAPFEALAASDPHFSALARQLRGLRPLVMPSAFEAAVWAIIGQQINVAFAYRLKRALIERFGERLHYQGRAYALFPAPERLAPLDPAELRLLQFSRQKTQYILELARLLAERRLDLEALANRPAEEARTVLLGLRGVGRWTAEYVLMRGLGARDEIPAADLGLQEAARRVFGLPVRPTEAELRALAERWAGWRSYFAFYLWYSLAPGGGV